MNEIIAVILSHPAWSAIGVLGTLLGTYYAWKGLRTKQEERTSQSKGIAFDLSQYRASPNSGGHIALATNVGGNVSIYQGEKPTSTEPQDFRLPDTESQANAGAGPKNVSEPAQLNNTEARISVASLNLGGMRLTLAKELCAQGNAFEVQGNHIEAIRCYQRSLEIVREFGGFKDEVMEKTLLQNIGKSYLESGDYRSAIRACEESLRIAQKHALNECMVDILGIIGIANFAIKDHPAAFECFNEALRISRQVGYKVGSYTILANLGIASTTQGEHEDAVTYFNEAIAIAHSIGHQVAERQMAEALVETRRKFSNNEEFAQPNGQFT